VLETDVNWRCIVCTTYGQKTAKPDGSVPEVERKSVIHENRTSRPRKEIEVLKSCLASLNDEDFTKLEFGKKPN
jgi:hypothetical protein